MSTILKVTVISKPGTIEIVWQGKPKLLQSHVHLDSCRVFPPGRTETLEGWKFGRAVRSLGNDRYELVLTRPETATEYLPQPQELIALELHLGPPHPKASPIAGAVVDGNDSDCEKLVADAINQTGAQIESEIQSVGQAVQDVNQGVQAAGATAQTSYTDFKDGYDKSVNWLTGFPFQVSDGAAGGGGPSSASVPGASASAVIDREMPPCSAECRGAAASRQPCRRWTGRSRPWS